MSTCGRLFVDWSPQLVPMVRPVLSLLLDLPHQSVSKHKKWMTLGSERFCQLALQAVSPLRAVFPWQQPVTPDRQRLQQPSLENTFLFI